MVTDNINNMGKVAKHLCVLLIGLLTILIVFSSNIYADILVQKEGNKLSQTVYYKADIEDYSTFKKIGVWRGGAKLIYASNSVYFNIKLAGTKNLKGIILGFRGSRSTYDHQFDITIELQEYDGTSWNTILTKTIKFPPDWYYYDGSQYYYCDVPIVYDIELETPITLDSSKQYRIKITPSENIYIASKYFSGNDGTNYIYRILYSNETKNYESGDVVVVRDELELDVDTLEYYDQGDSYYYDRYVSIIVLNNGKLKITNDSPEDIKLKGSIIITPSPNNGVYIGTEDNPISKDKKIVITLGYGLTSNYYGSPWEAVNDGFFIYTEKAEQEEATIIGFNSRHEIILEGILDKWNVGDEISVPIDYPYPTDNRKTITNITYDTENNRTIVTLDSDLRGDPLIGEKVFMLSQSVTIRGERPRYFSTAYESYVKYDKSQEVLRGVRCENIYLSAKSMTDDSYVVMKNTYRVRGWHLGTIVFPSESYKNLETHSGGYIKRLVILGTSTINIYEYDTTIDEIIAYNSNYVFGSGTHVNDRLIVNKIYANHVTNIISAYALTMLIIGEIIAKNVSALFDMHMRSAQGIIKIGTLKGKCKRVGYLSICRAIIETTEELEPFDDPFPTPLMGLWSGYLDFRVYNLGGKPNTGMFSDGKILIVSTGDELPDTTKKTGLRAYKVFLRYGEGKIRYTIPVLEENLPIAIQLAVKFSDSFVSSPEKYFKIRITMPDGNIYEKEVENFTTDWQYISVSGTSTVKGIATIEYEMKANSNSYLYIDDEVLLTGYIVDMSGAETWQNGLSTYPPIKTQLSGLDVWSVSLDALTVPNSVGSFIKSLSEEQHYGILNRETMHKTNSTIKLIFRSKSNDTVRIIVYKPDGSEVLNDTMTEFEDYGIYYYDLTFDTSWGTGDFLIVCKDENTNLVDSMSITILSEDEWWATKQQVNDTEDTITSALENISSNVSYIKNETNEIYNKLNNLNINVTGIRIRVTSPQTVLPDSVIRVDVVVTDLSGQLIDPDSIIVRVYDPTDRIFDQGSPIRISTGQYYFKVYVGEAAVRGQYKVEVLGTWNNITTKGIATFRVEAGGPYDVVVEVENDTYVIGTKEICADVKVYNFGDIGQDVRVHYWIDTEDYKTISSSETELYTPPHIWVERTLCLPAPTKEGLYYFKVRVYYGEGVTKYSHDTFKMTTRALAVPPLSTMDSGIEINEIATGVLIVLASSIIVTFIVYHRKAILKGIKRSLKSISRKTKKMF